MEMKKKHEKKEDLLYSPLPPQKTSCTASGTPFSSSSLRFMCDCCEQMFLGTYVRKYLVSFFFFWQGKVYFIYFFDFNIDFIEGTITSFLWFHFISFFFPFFFHFFFLELKFKNKLNKKVLVSSSTDVKPVRYCDTCKERVSATEGVKQYSMFQLINVE